MTSIQRKAQVAAANLAATGRTRTESEMCLSAISREANADAHASGYELRLFDLLRARGILCQKQVAVGPYNCDLAFSPVAVEVWGGGWHFGGRHMARTPKRFRYFMDRGWHIMAVVVNDRFPLTAAVADHVAAYIKQARREPTRVREYRVVWGAGQFTTRGSAEDDEITVKKPFACSRH
jgi:hypothetical protein